MNVFILIIGLVIACIAVAYIFANPRYTIIYCVLLLDVDFCFRYYMEQSKYQSLIKAIILISTILLMLKARKAIHKCIYLNLGIILALSIVLYFRYRLTDFYFTDILLSFATTLTGFLVLAIPWGENSRIFGLKILVWAAPVNALLSFFVNGYILDTTRYRLSSMDNVAILASIAVLGMIAAYVLYSVYGIHNYLWLFLINFAICGLCNMRGALIFATIILIGIAISHLRRVPKNILQKIMLLLPVLVVGLAFIVRIIIIKSLDFTNSVDKTSAISTSNRFWAWEQILDATKEHRIFGWGLGYTKKITGIWINYGYQAVHNEYIRWLVETGIVGIVLIIICFVLVYRYVIKHNIGLTNGVIRAIFIGFAIFSITDNTMYGVDFWPSFCMLVSMLCENIGKEGKKIVITDRRLVLKRKPAK